MNSCVQDVSRGSPAPGTNGPVEPRPFHFVTVLRVLTGYSTHFLANGLFIVAAIPLALVLSPFPRTKYRCLHAMVYAWLAFYTRIYAPAIGVYSIAEISGLEKMATLGPVFYVSNHRGRLDALLLLGLLKRTGVVIKSKYTSAPALAALVSHFDFISIDSGLLSSLSDAVERFRRLVSEGKSLLVFPEGSRASSARLQPFKDVVFRLAMECGRPVVPIIIHSTYPFLSKVPHSLFPRGRNVYRIRFLDPEPLRPGDTHATLSDRVHRRMARELKELDKGTVWELPSPGRT